MPTSSPWAGSTHQPDIPPDFDADMEPKHGPMPLEDDNYDFFEQSYIIADYAYPKFIEGLQYNSDRTILPRYIDGIVNAIRRFKIKFTSN